MVRLFFQSICYMKSVEPHNLLEYLHGQSKMIEAKASFDILTDCSQKFNKEVAMRSRRKARESVLQALYQCDSIGNWTRDTIENYFQFFTNESDGSKLSIAERDNFNFARTLAMGVVDYIEFLDEVISQSSTHWNMKRMSRVDRNIMRFAAFEIGFLEDVPVNASINEAIEVAKRFGTDDSPMFINGVLDNLARVFRDKPDLVAELTAERKVVANG